MRIRKQKLIDLLVKLKPGLDQRGIMEETEKFIFTGKYIFTYNDRICVVTPFDSKFKCTIPSEEFIKIISGISGKYVSLIKGKNIVKIKGKKFKGELSTTTDLSDIMERFASMNLEGVKKWRTLPSDLIHGAYLCMFSASKDSTEIGKSCLKFQKDMIYSTDNLRISRYKMKKSVGVNFMIPARTIAELVKYEGVEKFAVDNAWIFFKDDEGTVFCCRRIKDKFPKCDHLFKFKGSKIKTMPDSLREAVDVASVMSEGDFDEDKLIDISMASGIMHIQATKEIGWIKQELRVAYDKTRKLEFQINPIFLSQIADKATVMMVGEDRVMFHRGNFEHLVSIK